MADSYFLVLIALCSVICFNDEVEADCGGLIEENSGIITTPGYPNNYPPNKTCIWQITVPPNYLIALHFMDFNLEEYYLCAYDSVTIKSKMKDGSIREQGKFCHSNNISNIISKSNILLVEFKSDEHSERTGFKAEFFNVSGCRKIIQDTSGVITSPLYPLHYPPNQYCAWMIRMPPNNLIGITFKAFNLQDDEDCIFDDLTIYNLMKNGNRRHYGTFCGSQVPSNITSESNTVVITFSSFSTYQLEGFKLDFFQVPLDCGGLIERSEGIISSPLFPSPYPPEMNCTWTLQAPLNNIIKLKFTHLSMNSSECEHDYVKIQSKMSDEEVLEHGKFCGGEAPPVIFSEGNVMLIQFLSNSEFEHQGFQIEYSFEECGGLIEEVKGKIRTPFYPHPYPPNTVCQWTILLPPQHKLKLHFPQFETEEGGDDCSNDFLLVQRETVNGEIHEYGKYCGGSGPPIIYSKDSIILTFVSDRSFQGRGFEAEYFIDKWTNYELKISSFKESTKTTYEPIKSTTMSDFENIEEENVTLTNEAYALSDKFESTVSSIVAHTTSLNSVNDSVVENQQKESEDFGWRKEANILSESLKTLTEKFTSIEERLKPLFDHYDHFLKRSKSLTSKSAFLREEGKNISNPSERQLLKDCEKYTFFLRRMLDSES